MEYENVDNGLVKAKYPTTMTNGRYVRWKGVVAAIGDEGEDVVEHPCRLGDLADGSRAVELGQDDVAHPTRYH